MKTQAECDDFAASAQRSILARCRRCDGENRPGCPCGSKYSLAVSAFEACIPRDFWFSEPGDVKYNKEAFEAVILPYIKRLRRARANGYGLVLLGDNGVGKTMFTSIVLVAAIKRGFTAYYTTLPQLDHNLKRGMSDREIAQRLDWMLTSDFVAIDEMGKERYKDGDSWMRLQVERILKERFDNSLPTLLASNADLEALSRMYGSTIGSILDGKYQQVALEPGDFRLHLRKKMEKDMGYV